MGVIKQIFFVPLVSQNDGNFGYLSNITFMFAKLLRHMGNMNTIQRNDFFAKSKFSLVDKLTNDTKVQVLELMHMHPKERLGLGYFDSQLV